MLDDCTAVRLACTRSGDILMLGRGKSVPGVDDRVKERRAAMAEAPFAGAMNGHLIVGPEPGGCSPVFSALLHENRTTVLKAKL